MALGQTDVLIAEDDDAMLQLLLTSQRAVREHVTRRDKVSHSWCIVTLLGPCAGSVWLGLQPASVLLELVSGDLLPEQRYTELMMSFIVR